MIYVLDFRVANTGGAVVPGKVVPGPGLGDELQLRAEPRVTFLLHGYNVNRENGRASLLRLAHDFDLVGQYLRQLASTPLLTADEEVELAKRIEAGVYAKQLLESGSHESSSRAELVALATDGDAAKDHMIRANLRLVVPPLGLVLEDPQRRERERADDEQRGKREAGKAAANRANRSSSASPPTPAACAWKPCTPASASTTSAPRP